MSSITARVRTAPPAARQALAAVAVAGVALFYVQILLPGTGGGRGTPGAILFTGLVFGLVNALTAAAIVLVYRTVRIINFAQTAIGAAGAELSFRLLQQTDVPFAVAFAVGLLLAGLLGLAFDLVFGRRFFSASRLVMTVVTIAVAGLSVITTAAVTRLPFFSEPTSIGEAFGTVDIRSVLPFPGFHFEVGDLQIRFGFPEIFAIEASIVALLLVGAFLRFTRIGVGVRAMAENPERSGLLGISVGTMSSVVWVIAGLLGGLSVFLFGSIETPGAAAGFAPGVLVPALAAATVARFRSIPVAAAAAVLIGVVVRATLHSYGDHAALVNVAILAVIVLGLLSHSRHAGRSEQGAASSWQAVDEQRPIPKELASLATVRVTRWVLIALGLAAVIIYPYLVDIAEMRLGGTIALLTVTAVSVVLLTGWAGQVSLGQWAFAGVGAVVAASLTSRAGIPFWFAAPMAAVISAGVALLLGLTALRIRGLFLAVTTLAFAFALHSALFEERYFGWLLPREIERPTLFFLDFDDERSMYYLTIATLVLALVVVFNLRRSRFGRILIASRDNEQNLAAFGVSVVRTRLLAFAVAGSLAGLAGAVFAHLQLGTTADAFDAQRSIDVFLMTVVGGIGSMGGALLGSLFWNSSEHFWPTNQIVQFLRPFLVLIVLYSFPAGFISVFTKMRDEGLRIIAQRRQIVVPSLFADYDPEALERRLIPLAVGSEDAGLGALPADERYALRSELYRGRTERVGEGS